MRMFFTSQFLQDWNHTHCTHRATSYSLSTTQSACNRGLIFDEHFTFSQKIRPSPNYYTSQLRCIRHALIPPQLVSVPSPLFSSNSIAAAFLPQPPKILHNPPLTDSELSCARCCQLLNPVISLSSYALHWIKIAEHKQKLSLTYKALTTTQPPSRRKLNSSSLFAALALHLSSLLLGDQHHPRSIRYASLCLWNQLLLLYVRLIPLSLYLACIFLLLSHLLTLSTYHFHYPLAPSLFHSRLKI